MADKFLNPARVGELWAKVKAALGLKMDAATYDPTGKAEDVFAYADSKANAAESAAKAASRPSSWTPAWGDVSGKPTVYSPATHGHAAAEVSFTDGETFQQKCDAGQLTGPQGAVGPKGDKGDTGPVGPQGPKGDKGDTGAVGPQGPAGTQGPKGDVGPVGKSAYQAARDAGYTGTEAELSAALANLGSINTALDAINGEVA